MDVRLPPWITGVLTLIVFQLICHATVSAGRRLHRQLLQRVLRARRTFFDTTPTGRILNWFTKDMDDLDVSLPKEVVFLLYSIPPMLATLCLTSVAVPYTLLVIGPVSIVFFIIQVSFHLRRIHSRPFLEQLRAISIRILPNDPPDSISHLPLIL